MRKARPLNPSRQAKTRSAPELDPAPFRRASAPWAGPRSLLARPSPGGAVLAAQGRGTSTGRGSAPRQGGKSVESRRTQNTHPGPGAAGHAAPSQSRRGMRTLRGNSFCVCALLCRTLWPLGTLRGGTFQKGFAWRRLYMGAWLARERRSRPGTRRVARDVCWPPRRSRFPVHASRPSARGRSKGYAPRPRKPGPRVSYVRVRPYGRTVRWHVAPHVHVPSLYESLRQRRMEIKTVAQTGRPLQFPASPETVRVTLQQIVPKKSR